MKNKIIFFFLIISSTTFCQQNSFTGTVIDFKTKKPIIGVLLILDNEIIAYTDSKGEFNFKSSKFKVEIIFTDFLFQTKLKKLKNDESRKKPVVIELNEKVHELDEVVIKAIGKKYTKKEIVKNAFKAHTSFFRKEPYWSTINSKKIISKNDSLLLYVEMEGVAFMVGKDKNVFNGPILIPFKVRRTAQKKKGHNNYDFASSFLTYRFFEQIHPLSKKGNRFFDFNIEKTMYLDNELCYVINYKERKPISVLRYQINFMRGQFWVAKKDFKLRKLTTSFQLSRGIDAVYTINYIEKENNIYPNFIFYDYTYVNYPNAGRNKGELTFININVKPRENYRKKNKLYNQNYFNWSSEYNFYDKEYWSKKTFRNSKFKDSFFEMVGQSNLDSIFAKGASKTIRLPKEQIGGKLLEEEKQIISIMKKDLKN